MIMLVVPVIDHQRDPGRRARVEIFRKIICLLLPPGSISIECGLVSPHTLNYYSWMQFTIILQSARI